MSYGTWITHEGEVIEVEDQCSHDHVMSYEDAYREGWIATITGTNYDLFCVRLNPDRVTRAALNSLLRLYKDSGQSLIVEDTYASKTFYGLGVPKSKREDIAYIKSLMNNLND